MNANAEEMELRERLDLMQRMIAEGRQSTQRWGWTFLLWGLAYYVAIAWSVFGKTWVAWPVTMIAAAVVTAIRISRTKHNQPNTTIGRALASIWRVMGIVLFAVMVALGASQRGDLHVAVAVVCAMLAMANGVSGSILRWKMQLGCALVWLATGVSACFISDMLLAIVSLAAIFVCQIAFGVYMMVIEKRERGQVDRHA